MAHIRSGYLVLGGPDRYDALARVYQRALDMPQFRCGNSDKRDRHFRRSGFAIRTDHIGKAYGFALLLN